MKSQLQYRAANILNSSDHVYDSNNSTSQNDSTCFPLHLEDRPTTERRKPPAIANGKVIRQKVHKKNDENSTSSCAKTYISNKKEYLEQAEHFTLGKEEPCNNPLKINQNFTNLPMQRDAVREKLNMLIETKCENEENKKQLDHQKDELKKLEIKNSDLKSSYLQGQLEIGKLKEILEKKDKDIEQLTKDLQHSQELHDADIKNLKAQLNRNARATHNHGDPADIKRLKNELMIREQETQMLKKDTDIKLQSYISQIANLTEREAMYKSQVNRLLKEQKEIKNYDTINQQLGRANEELQLYKAKYIRKAKKYDKLKAFASKCRDQQQLQKQIECLSKENYYLKRGKAYMEEEENTHRRSRTKPSRSTYQHKDDEHRKMELKTHRETIQNDEQLDSGEY